MFFLSDISQYPDKVFPYLSDTGNRGHNVLVFFGLVPNVLVGNAYRAVWYGNARDGELNLQYAFPIRRSGTRGEKCR